MERLLKGIVEFRKTDFEKHKELFTRISEGQNPHTLFIGCSDSRLVPNFITKSLPGELFIVRNVANLVPVYQETGDFLGVTSAIEYAVKVLEVENILICGHSNCGGCAALYKPDEMMEHIPHTKKWLELAAHVRERVLEVIPDQQDLEMREWLTEQINIVEQMKHLLTYPYIEERFRNGTLNILGWHYIIETGEIFSYNREDGFFELIN
jgi:carbonic anhydrase